jgi:putative PIN family toxin of toxin-antitoxin system
VRVVLDSNVVVSGVLTTHGVCGQILDLLVEGLFEICVDHRILDEYHNVLHREELGLDPDDIDELIGFVRSRALPVTAVPRAVVLPDPDDLPFVEVAGAAGAILVTGNTRHFPSDICTGVKILSPAEFLELIRTFESRP